VASRSSGRQSYINRSVAARDRQGAADLPTESRSHHNNLTFQFQYGDGGLWTAGWLVCCEPLQACRKAAQAWKALTQRDIKSPRSQRCRRYTWLLIAPLSNPHAYMLSMLCPQGHQ